MGERNSPRSRDAGLLQELCSSMWKTQQSSNKLFKSKVGKTHPIEDCTPKHESCIS